MSCSCPPDMSTVCDDCTGRIEHLDHRVDEERWAPVPGHPGYEVSDLGRVRGLARTVICRNGSRKPVKGKVLALAIEKHSGYQIVNLQARTRRVHRLVLEAFVGPCPVGQEALHANDEPTDNRLANLSWGTRTQNAADQLRNGGNYYANRTTCPRGHRLVEPNLDASQLLRGRRSCRSCAKAGSRIRTSWREGRVPLVKKVPLSHRYYEIIMNDERTSNGTQLRRVS